MLNPFGGLKKVFKPLNKAVGKVAGGVGKAVGTVGRATHLPAPPGFGKKKPNTVSKLAPSAGRDMASKMKAKREA